MQTELALYYHRVAGIPAVVARTFNLVGKGMSARLSIGSFMAQIAEAKDGGSISVGHIDTFRDFLTAETAVAAYWNLLTLSKPGEIYNICSGHPTLVRAMLDELMSQSGKHLSINVDPNRFKGDDIPAMFGDPSKYLALLAMNEERRIRLQRKGGSKESPFVP